MLIERKNPIKTESKILLPHILHGYEKRIISKSQSELSCKYSLCENVFWMFVFSNTEVKLFQSRIQLTSVEEDAL